MAPCRRPGEPINQLKGALIVQNVVQQQNLFITAWQALFDTRLFNKLTVLCRTFASINVPYSYVVESHHFYSAPDPSLRCSKSSRKITKSNRKG
jgi:hypothetical protein